MSSIKKNLAYQTFYEVLILILPFFTSPYIARVMGAEYLGIFSYTYSIAYYFQMFGMLGIKFYGNRSIAKARDDKAELERVFNEIFSLHAVLSLICFAVYLIYCIIFAQYRTYSLLQGLMVLASVFDVSWLFFGLEKFKTTVTRSTVIKILSVISIFVFVKSVEDFPKYILIMAGSQFLNSIVLFLMSFKEIKYKVPELRDLKQHLKPMFVLFVPILALSLFKYMDKIMLGSIGDKVELGYYENAEKVLNIPLSIVFSFGSVMLPRISNLVAQDDKSAVNRYLGLSIKYMVGISFAMAFGMAAISSVFAPVFWGDGFTKSGRLIALLAISIPFSTVASIVRNQDMIPTGHDRYYSYSIIAGAIVNLILNYLLIPKYQAIGVTIGTIIAEIIVFICELWLVRGTNHYAKMLAQPFAYFIPSVVMFYVVRLLGKVLGLHVYTLVIQVTAGVLVFCFASFLVLLIIKDKDAKRAVELIRSKITNRPEK